MKTPDRLELEGVSRPVLVRRSLKARKVRLVVRVDRHELVVPARMSWAQAHAFFLSCIDWLRERDRQLASRPVADPSVVYWAGTPYRVEVMSLGSRSPEFRGDTVQIRAESLEAARRGIENNLRQQARLILTQKVDRWSPVMGVAPTSLRFGDARQRWGSCNSRGGLNLNWRLAMTPERCTDYVVVHELAHLRHMHHGPAFWAEVERYFPARKEAEAWLKAHAHLILRRV